MPGSYVLKPIEANLQHNTELLGKMSPYCTCLLGNQKFKGQVCKKGGKHPFWYDTITLPATNDSSVRIELKDQDKFTRDDSIGDFTLDLKEIEARGQVKRWYPMTHHNKPAGEILMEAVFKPDESILSQVQNSESPQLHVGKETQMMQGATISSPNKSHTDLNQEHHLSSLHESHGSIREGAHIFIEQSQIVAPHTFKKEVQVVETRPVLKEIEVLQPHKVRKEVQYTEAIPVKHMIEVVEPQVVTKEIEVIEPRVVTKKIQVIENLPVKKMVEVIEPRVFLREVDTFEPQVFTKQVEVLEQVPVKKQVTVTEPITVVKTVDFIEPIITTKTITKELLEPVIVDEKVTRSVGPATFLCFESEVREREVVNKLGEVKISEQYRIVGQEKIIEEQRFWMQDDILEQDRLRKSKESNYLKEYSSNYQSQKEKSPRENKENLSQVN